MQIEENDGIHSVTSHIMSQIVKEQDEYTIDMIEEYIKCKQAEGDIVIGNIIPEGKLRHIINLGITAYNEIQKEPKKLLSRNYFPETVYNEYLHQQINELQKENQKLRNQIDIMKNVSGLRSIDTNLEGGE